MNSLRTRSLALAFLLLLAALPGHSAPSTSTTLVDSPMIITKVGATTSDYFLQKISIDLRDMDIVDVLKFLSLKGKFNVAINKAISGRITLVMKEVTIGDALDIILRANNLAYYRVNNIVYVMTAEEYLATYGKKFNDETQVRIVSLKYAKPSYVLAALDSLKSNVGKIVIDEDTGSVVLIDTDEKLGLMLKSLDEIDVPQETITFKLQYALAKDVAAQLKSRLDAKSVGSIQADERANLLIINALPDRMVEIKRLVQDLDSPTKAVFIDVRILKITLNPQYDKGIDWSNLFGNSHDRNLQDLKPRASFPISSTIAESAVLAGVASLTYGTLDPGAIQLELKALRQVSDTRVIAQPKLMVTNGEEANIHIGDTVPYVTSTTTGTGDTATTSEQINFIDIGIKLKVVATINDDGMVMMKVRPEISTQLPSIPTPQGAEIPQVNTTFVETSVMVENDHTVIIGGLKQYNKTSNTKGLPYLMDVPILGHLFKSDSKTFEDTEIAIFMTPHIVERGHDVMDRPLKIHEDKNYGQAQSTTADTGQQAVLEQMWKEVEKHGTR